MKTVQSGILKWFVLAIFFFTGFIFPVATYSLDFTVPHSVSPTTNRLLEQAVLSLSSGEYQAAEFQSSLGTSYDPVLADFPYIEALSLVARASPRKNIITALERSLAKGMFWRSYDRSEALVLCARFYGETCRYYDSLALLDQAGERPTADSDYVRAFSLYGLGQHVNARTTIAQALDRWPFDSRFPRLFLQREKNLPPTPQGRSLASTILSRLYVWEDQDRELLLLAVEYESDPIVRERNIRVYRNMRKSDRSQDFLSIDSTIAALRYGLLTEQDAIEEIFSASENGIPLSVLTSFSNLAGSKIIRDSFRTLLRDYEGIITLDSNEDGIIDVRIKYQLGLPFQVEIDSNQDGITDYAIQCNLGSPTRIDLAETDQSVFYDTYPYLRSVTLKDREYTLKPLALSWTPVSINAQDYGLENLSFYTISALQNIPLLTSLVLASHAAFYVEKDPFLLGGTTRVVLQDSIPILSESRENGRLYSWSTYKRGVLEKNLSDRNGDGYFETSKTFDLQGNLLTVTIDRNANRIFEYIERYKPDGSISIQWDTDENGIPDIFWTMSPDKKEVIEYLHPVTAILVRIDIDSGSPRSLSYGDSRIQVIKDPAANVWWVSRIPLKSREILAFLDKTHNPEDSPVVVYTTTVEGQALVVVRTGGKCFVEILDE